MGDAVEIRVEGLKAFSRDLKKLDGDLPKALRVALNASVDGIVQEAKGKVPTKTGRAKSTVRAQSTRTLARVAAGGKKAPYYPWLDFGGRVGRNRSVERQFRKRGRFIYLAYFNKRDSGEFQAELEAALLGVAKSAGIEVE